MMCPSCERHLTPVETDEQMEVSFDIRRSVFVEGQGVDPHIELDELDAASYHVLYYRECNPVGTGRVSFLEDGAKIGRIAVLPGSRGKGIGTCITNHLVQVAHDRGYRTIYAHVQTHARGFYSRLGFEETGGTFLEADIEHVKMVIRLPE